MMAARVQRASPACCVARPPRRPFAAAAAQRNQWLRSARRRSAVVRAAGEAGQPEVVVVGAGVAGLNTAAKLHEAGECAAPSAILSSSQMPAACVFTRLGARGMASVQLNVPYADSPCPQHLPAASPYLSAGVPVLLVEASDGVGGRVGAARQAATSHSHIASCP